MATLRKRKGKWTVEIRRKGHRNVYATFVQKSDARGFINKVENEIQQQKYKDISEAANTTFKVVLHRYIREKIENKKDKQRERSKLNVILRHHIVKHNMSELKTSDFAKYRDDRVAAGITNSTINRELSAMRPVSRLWFSFLNCDKISKKYFSNPKIQHDLNTIDDYLDVECVLNYFILLYFVIG